MRDAAFRATRVPLFVLIDPSS